MNRKTLIVLGVATALAVGAALFVDHSRTPQSNVAEKAGMLAPGLRDHVNEVTKITFTSAGNQPAVTLVRGERGWTVSQRGGYPADLGKLREYLLRFADASLLEQKTANKDRYPDLGVEDITAADAKGVLVDLDGLPAPLRVIVGTFDGQGGNGTFVRRADEAQSWLAKGTLTPDKDPAAWLAKDLPGIAAERVARVEIRHADGRSVRVERKAPGDTQLVIADIPKGRQPGSEYVANGLGSVLAELRLDDVAPAAEVPPPQSAVQARYTTFDGIVVDVQAWKVGERAHATFAARLDAEAAARHIDQAQEDAATEHAAALASTAKPADAETGASADAGTPEAPLAVRDPAADRSGRLAALEAEVAELNRAFAGWSFVLPAYKYANIDKSLDDLLAPVEAKSTSRPKP